MVKVIIVKNLDFKDARNTFRRISQRTPIVTSEAMNQWGLKLEDSIKLSAKQSGIQSFTGTLQTKGIQWRQRPKGLIGFLFMRNYAVALDSMRPHYVSIRKSRSLLLKWALQANHRSIRQRARAVSQGKLKSFPIFVRPRPYIQKGFNRQKNKLGPMVARRISTTIKEA